MFILQVHSVRTAERGEVSSPSMGVDTPTYRQRIGLFAQASCSKRKSRSPRYTPSTKWNVWTDFSWRIVLFTVALSAVYAEGIVLRAMMQSNCVGGLLDSLSGQGVQRESVDATWMGQPTLGTAPYQWNMSALILLSGSVERNPGPGDKETLEPMIRSCVADEIRNCMLNMVLPEIQKVQDKVIAEINTLKEEIKDVRGRVKAQEDYLEILRSRQDEMEDNVQEMQKRLEDQEIRDRRDNVILYDVTENGQESYEDSEQRFIEVVNGVLPGRLQCRDVRRAHRIGKPVQGKTRPLIACLSRTADKIAILQARSQFKDSGVGVSTDLTYEQRQQLRLVRAQGKFGYFKNGVLHVSDQPRHTGTGERQNRPITRSQARAEQEASGGS